MRTIFHIDVNSAYLSWTSVENLKTGNGPDLREIPAIIGGDQKTRHGVVLAKSIPAKKFGIIFVCKYRKKLLVSRQISDDIKQFSYEICQRHSVIIRYMETDKDHIHYMIETEPTMSISKIVNLMKSYTTYHI